MTLQREQAATRPYGYAGAILRVDLSSGRIWSRGGTFC